MDSNQSHGVANAMSRLEGRLQAQIDTMNKTLDNLVTEIVALKKENEYLLDQIDQICDILRRANG